LRLDPDSASAFHRAEWAEQAHRAYDNGGAPSFWCWLAPALPDLDWDELAWGIRWLGNLAAAGDDEWHFAVAALSLARDCRCPIGDKKRASLLRLVDDGMLALFGQVPGIEDGAGSPYQTVRRLTWSNRHAFRSPQLPGEPLSHDKAQDVLVVDTLGFPPEGDDCAARWLARAYELGWRHLIAYNWRGGRFAGCGLGPNTAGTRLDLYGDVGDYAASGLDGAEVHLHGDGQDQVGQILKAGRLVIHGDVGQTFLYGAKGGEIYVLGSAAGRPLINAVGRPRAVINGTCLDYLAESFMAGDPLDGGGFVVLNGVAYGEDGRLHDLPTPYPGGNLFSLASGGAVYLRDPHRRVDKDQLNGGVFGELTAADWLLIEPYLRQNEGYFGIGADDLLCVDGVRRAPAEVYRKTEVKTAGVLSDT
jgi:hypothetical protein